MRLSDRRNVDLPQPDGPMSAVTSFGRILHGDAARARGARRSRSSCPRRRFSAAAGARWFGTCGDGGRRWRTGRGGRRRHHVITIANGGAAQHFLRVKLTFATIGKYMLTVSAILTNMRAAGRARRSRRAERILERLLSGPLPVGELARGFPVSRPAISQHLRVLKHAHLVVDRPDRQPPALRTRTRRASMRCAHISIGSGTTRSPRSRRRPRNAPQHAKEDDDDERR